MSIETNTIPASTKRSFTGRAWSQIVFGFCTQKQHVYNKKKTPVFLKRKVRPLKGNLVPRVLSSHFLRVQRTKHFVIFVSLLALLTSFERFLNEILEEMLRNLERPEEATLFFFFFLGTSGFFSSYHPLLLAPNEILFNFQFYFYI